MWQACGRPLSEDDFPARSKLHFYGFGKPELDASELFLARHLTRDLGRPYR